MAVLSGYTYIYIIYKYAYMYLCVYTYIYIYIYYLFVHMNCMEALRLQHAKPDDPIGYPLHRAFATTHASPASNCETSRRHARCVACVPVRGLAKSFWVAGYLRPPEPFMGSGWGALNRVYEVTLQNLILCSTRPARMLGKPYRGIRFCGR